MRSTFESNTFAGAYVSKAYRVLNITLILATLVAFLLTIFFNAASSYPNWGD